MRTSPQVFDGKVGSYSEGSEEALRTTPVNAYGASKLAAEQAALALLQRCVVLRLSLVYGPAAPRGGNKTSTFLQFMDASLGNASAAPLQLFSDEIRCPVAVADVCHACCRLVSLCSSPDQLQPFLQQRVHCGGPSALSRVGMGEAVCRVQGYSFSDRVLSVTRDVAMADAAFKFASPPDISMKGRLFAQLLQVRARAAAHNRARLFIDAAPRAMPHEKEKGRRH
jgi:dTDP-4-dehydrorhamnose reductase